MNDSTCRPVRSAVVLVLAALLAVAAAPGRDDAKRTPGTENDLSVAEWRASVETFLVRALEEVYDVSLRPVTAVVSYDSTATDSLPRCNGVVRTAEFYEGNAFYCHAENTIAVDAARLLPALRRDHGDVMVGVVVAHEYGHAVQRQVGLEGTDGELELHADCVAGAWFGSLVGSRFPRASELLDVVLRALDGFGEGEDGLAPGRREAFTLGNHRGLAGCDTLLVSGLWGPSRPVGMAPGQSSMQSPILNSAPG